MPALPSVPQVLKLLMTLADTDDNNMIWRMFLQYAGTAPIDSDLQTLGAAIGSAWASHLASFWTSNQTMTAVNLEDLTSPTSAVFDQVVSHVGTRSGTPCANGLAVNMAHNIARRYRGGHPKTFLTALVDGDRADVAHWDSTTLSNLSTAYNAFTAAINSAVWAGGLSLIPVNVSYYHGFQNFTYPSGRTRPRPLVRDTPVVDLIISTQPVTKIGSQRRRYM